MKNISYNIEILIHQIFSSQCNAKQNHTVQNGTNGNLVKWYPEHMVSDCCSLDYDSSKSQFHFDGNDLASSLNNFTSDLLQGRLCQLVIEIVFH